tara:strand:+ start:90 stop:845 length:756 start_codon:yes stop_codon:yes gene_type:complete
MKKIFFTLLVCLPLIGFGQTITNGSFENWDTTYYYNGSSNILDTIYNVENPLRGTLSSWEEELMGNFGMSQTTDSYDGNYALILHNWYQYANEDVQYFGSLNANPTYFSGYYKYFGDTYLFTNTSPQTIVSICLFNNQDTIAFSSVRLDTISEYTKFEIELNYLNNLTADSVHIMLLNSDQSCNTTNLICNLFYIDKLEFSNTTTIKELKNSNKTLLKITDVLGRKTKETSNTPLFYIYDNGTVDKKIIIE